MLKMRFTQRYIFLKILMSQVVNKGEEAMLAMDKEEVNVIEVVVVEAIIVAKIPRTMVELKIRSHNVFIVRKLVILQDFINLKLNKQNLQKGRKKNMRPKACLWFMLLEVNVCHIFGMWTTAAVIIW